MRGPGVYTAEQRLQFVDEWQRSGLSARDFAKKVGLAITTVRPGQILHVWKSRVGAVVTRPQKLEKRENPAERPQGYRVKVALNLDGTTHAALVTKALGVSMRVNRLVGPEEYAESILRNFLTTGLGGGKKGRSEPRLKESHATEKRSGRGTKSGSRRAEAGPAHDDPSRKAGVARSNPR